MKHRFISISCIILSILLFLVPTTYAINAEITIMSSFIASHFEANASDYTSNPNMIAKLNDVFSGKIGIKTSSDASIDASLGTSNVPDNGVQLYACDKKVSGTSCWIYGNAVYYTLFSDVVANGEMTYYCDNSEKIAGSISSASYDVFRDLGVRQAVGAYVRTTTHSFIVLSYSTSGISIIEGNADGAGLIRISNYSWSEFNTVILKKGKKPIQYIVQPTDAYYQATYPNCSHRKYTGCGICTECGYEYEWELNRLDAGYYTTSANFSPRTGGPYDAAQKDETIKLKTGTVVHVDGSLTNAYNNKWYQISYVANGATKTGYVYSSYLKFDSLFPQSFEATVTSPSGIIPKSSWPVKGSVTSQNYPLDSIQAYLDGTLYATWYASNNETEKVELQPTDINWKLDFGALDSGKHTLTLKAKDKKHSSYAKVMDQVFYTETNSAPPQVYTVTFHANGGTCNTATASVKDGYEIGSLPTPTRTGYEFLGWYTDADGGSKVYENTIISGNITVYAQWTPIYHTVSYSANPPAGYQNATLPKNFSVIQHGKTLSESDFPLLYLVGYTLSGWYTDPVGGVQVTTSTAITSDITLYPHWTGETVTVIFNAKGGAVSLKQKDVIYGQTYGELPIPTKSGYTFAGWIYNGGTYQTYRVSSDSKVASSMQHTLYASWVETSYQVTGGKIYFDNTTGLITGADQTITAADIPETIDGATVIGIADNAFQGCVNLTSITFPETLQTIGNWAFRNCRNLSEIIIPSGVTQIGTRAFANCSSLKAIHVDQENTVYASANGVLMSKDQSVLIYCPGKYEAQNYQFVVNEGTEEISAYAFYDCETITTVVVPASVTDISNRAVYDIGFDVSPANTVYSSIDGVLFDKGQTHLLCYSAWRRYYCVPEGVEVIEESAFAGRNIRSVILPDSLTRIENRAFANCYYMESITIPANVSYIGDRAFDVSSQNVSQTFRGIQEVYFLGTPPTLGQYAFGASSAEEKNTVLYYRDWMQGWGSAEYSGYTAYAYESHYAVDGGLIYFNTISGEITGCSDGLTAVVIPAKIGDIVITSISETAFQNCENLKEITIPSSITAIPQQAFDGSGIQTIVYTGTIEEWISLGQVNGFICSGDISIQCADGTIPSNACYAGTCGDGLVWYYTEDKTLYIEGNGTMQDYPPYWNSTSKDAPPWGFLQAEICAVSFSEGVTYIGQGSFWNCKAVASVDFPDKCVKIARCAFGGCKALTSLELPCCLEIIDYGAFEGCSALTSLEIPASVKEIGYAAFEDCAKLKRITLPVLSRIYARCFYGIAPNAEVYFDGTSVQWSVMAGSPRSYVENGTIVHCSDMDLDASFTAIGRCGENVVWKLFEDGTLVISGSGQMTSTVQSGNKAVTEWYTSYRIMIERVVIEEGVTSISENAFYDCMQLSSVEIPTSVCYIGAKAFYWCNKLTSIELPNAEIELADNVFSWCTNLNTVVIPDGLSKIGTQTFSNCDSLLEIVLPETLVSIGEEAFYGCNNLQKVTLPGSLKSIGRAAFAETDLHSIYIPKGVTELSNAFDGCEKLESVTVADENGSFSADENVLFSKDRSALLFVPPEIAVMSYEIPAGVETIETRAFQNCWRIYEIVFPDSVKEIKSAAFSGCSQLQYIEFEGAPPVISENAFVDICATAKYLPEDDRWTEEYMQQYGGNLTWKPAYTIVASGSCGENLFWELNSIGNMRIWGSGEMDSYVNEMNLPWSGYRSSIYELTLDKGVTGIGNYAFYGCRNLREIILPDGLLNIGSVAFTGANIERLDLPESVEHIDYAAFSDCDRLKIVTISSGKPQQVDANKSAPFVYCDSLQEVHFLNDAPESPRAWVRDWDYDKELSIYYPTGNSTWTQELIEENDDENLTWIPVEEGNKKRSDLLSWYFVEDEGRLVVWGEGAMEDYSSENQSPWHKYAEAIRFVTIAQGVTGIGNYAFCDCVNLEIVTFEGSAPTISANAFSGVETHAYYTDSDATWTTDILNNYGGTIIWRGGQFLGKGMFWNLDASGTLRIWGVGEMPEDSTPWWDERNSVESLVIEEGVTYISYGAFAYCENLISLTLPSTLTELGPFAFQYCSGIENVYITDVGMWCSMGIRQELIPDFYYESENNYQYNEMLKCTFPHISKYGGTIYVNGVELQYVEIPSNVDEIRPYAFAHSFIRSVIIPDSVATIGEHAFDRCNNLTSVDMGDAVKEIKGWAFYYCCNLREINFPQLLEAIGIGTFEGSGLTSVFVPDGVITIGEDAFFNSELAIVTIGAGTQEIGDGAFRWCDNLISISVNEENKLFSSDKTGILYNADKTVLMLCPRQLKGDCVIPATVTVISDYAFESCQSIDRIMFCGHAPSFGVYAFPTSTICAYYPSNDDTWSDELKSSCSSIAQWIAFGGEVYDISSSGFCGENLYWSLNSDGQLLICGTGKMESFETAESIPWFNFREEIKEVVMTEGISSIGGNAFFYCTNLSAVSLPADIESIEHHAFEGCSSITSAVYGGTPAQWQQVSVEEGNSFLLNALGCNLIMGDTNGDGEIDTSDAVRLVRYLVDLVELSDSEKRAADVNGDGDITSADSIKLVRYLVGLVESLDSVPTRGVSHCVEGGEIKVATVTGKVGDTVTVPVEIAGNPGFAGFTLELNYPAELELLDIEKGDVLKNADAGSLTVNKNLINWNNFENTYEDGELLILTFRISAAASDGNYSVSIEPKESKESNFASEDGRAVRAAFTAGNVRFIAETSDVSQECPGAAFADMPGAGYWSHEAIDWAITAGVTYGTSATLFSPQKECARAEAVTFIWRAVGSPEPSEKECRFVDVDADAYYAKAVLWALENGITTGVSETAFRPDDVCSRAEIVTFLWRLSGSPNAAGAHEFADVDRNSYYEQAVAWAATESITNGIHKTLFGADVACTREQIVTFLYRTQK